MLTRIYGPERRELIGWLEITDNKEHHHFYSLQNIIKAMKER
jgi:hypothetical protein